MLSDFVALILWQTASYSNCSTSETTTRPVVQGDGLATLLCMSSQCKLEKIEELKVKLKLRCVYAPESSSRLWCALTAHEDFTRVQSALVHLA